MKKILRTIRRIEKKAYPRHMRMLQGIRTMSDLAEYAECSTDELVLLTGSNWYCIVADHSDWAEIVDLAAAGKFGTEIFRVIRVLKEKLRGKVIKMDARASTSYPIVMRLIDKYGAQVLHDEIWHWGDEEMHELNIQF